LPPEVREIAEDVRQRRHAEPPVRGWHAAAPATADAPYAFHPAEPERILRRGELCSALQLCGLFSASQLFL